VNVTGSGTKSLVYDLNGNLTSDGTKTFEWDPLNRLTAINNGTTRSEFTYNGLNQRVKIVEKDNGTVTNTKNLVWVGSEICEQRNETNTVKRRYYPQGMQVGPTNYWYTRDHLGSIRELTDSTGAVVTRYDYGPYGRRTRLFGTVEADFGFTGHYHHKPSGLALAQYRAYSADFGRWISRDPMGEIGGVNLYGYTSADPINLLDPLGLIDIGFYGSGGATTGNAALYDYVVNKQGGKMYDRTQAGQKEALDDIMKAKEKDPCDPVNIHGYSWGNRAARDLVDELNELGIEVNQLNLIDPVNLVGGPLSITVPGNVQSADNYYQTSGGPFHGGPAANPSSSVRNHNVSGIGVDHNTIVGYVLGQR
jgi:RHS repeat-associated protein